MTATQLHCGTFHRFLRPIHHCHFSGNFLMGSANQSFRMCWLADNTASCLWSGGQVASPLSCQIAGENKGYGRTVNLRDWNVFLTSVTWSLWHSHAALTLSLPICFCAIGWFSDNTWRCHGKWLYCCPQRKPLHHHDALHIPEDSGHLLSSRESCLKFLRLRCGLLQVGLGWPRMFSFIPAVECHHPSEDSVVARCCFALNWSWCQKPMCLPSTGTMHLYIACDNSHSRHVRWCLWQLRSEYAAGHCWQPLLLPPA
jgi:hypothetical protein